MADPVTRLNAALQGRYRIERQLVEDAELWSTWRFGMPVVMNSNERSE